MDSQESISKRLESIGRSMQNMDSEVRFNGEENDLKRARNEIDRLQALSEKADDSRTRFHAYLLFMFFEELWNNLTMVSSTHIRDSIIIRLLDSIGVELVDMAQQYRNSHMEQFYTGFENCYNNYIKEMREINEEIRERKSSQRSNINV